MSKKVKRSVLRKQIEDEHFRRCAAEMARDIDRIAADEAEQEIGKLRKALDESDHALNTVLARCDVAEQEAVRNSGIAESSDAFARNVLRAAMKGDCSKVGRLARRWLHPERADG